VAATRRSQARDRCSLVPRRTIRVARAVRIGLAQSCGCYPIAVPREGTVPDPAAFTTAPPCRSGQSRFRRTTGLRASELKQLPRTRGPAEPFSRNGAHHNRAARSTTRSEGYGLVLKAAREPRSPLLASPASDQPPTARALARQFVIDHVRNWRIQ
jgi:hypothetical protein